MDPLIKMGSIEWQSNLTSCPRRIWVCFPMENLRVESLADVTERKPPQRVLFTYYQGDINSVVDEHFERALKKATLPKDLSTRGSSSPKDLPISKSRSRAKAVKSGLCWSTLSHACSERSLKTVSRKLDRQALISVLPIWWLLRRSYHCIAVWLKNNKEVFNIFKSLFCTQRK